MRKVFIVRPEGGQPRLEHGVALLEKALTTIGYEATLLTDKELPEDYRSLKEPIIYVGIREQSEWIAKLEQSDLLLYNCTAPVGEGFYLGTCAGGGMTVVSGGSATGALYGCLELRDRLLKENAIPREIAFGDAPESSLRGPALGLQKTLIEPPRLTYEYPITPERFPWFYDLPRWEKLLDEMLDYRCNVLYIWSGHPFSSLVRVPDYPEAQEVTDEEMERNIQVFHWLTSEADRRGIWVVLKFYNIHIPYPFAQKHGLEQLQNAPRDITRDYTRKTLAQFVSSFPNIGIMVCLGETLRGTENKVSWFCDTIIPGIRDGVEMGGLKEEPPLILRMHDVDAEALMPRARELYGNLFTEWKFNGEGLTSWLPRGEWQERHRYIESFKAPHIMNVHIVANLEPFRYGSPSFIQKSMIAGHDRLGAVGLHLYPLFYWDWPYSPDKTPERLEQLERDWIWYAAWFRYAWNSRRDPELEREYWIGVLAQKYGSREAGEALLDAYEAGGECAPRILRRFGITEGNRQSMSLGMLMSQLTNDRRYSPNLQLWLSVAYQGERLDDFVKNECAGRIHLGETPYDAIDDIEYYAKLARERAEAAAAHVTCNREEYERIVTDMQAIELMSYSYTEKARAAVEILRYRYTMNEDMTGNSALLEKAREYMHNSLVLYRKLVELTQETYLYANSMQTPQRKIPLPNGQIYGHWSAMLPVYEAEYANFVKHSQELSQGRLPAGAQEAEGEIKPFASADFTIHTPGCEKYQVVKGNSVFNDCEKTIQNMAGEINGLTGIRFSFDKSINKGVALDVEFHEDSRILIAYFNVKGHEWMKPQTLETNTHADARGGLDPVIQNAMKLTGLPGVNIHAFTYGKGRYEIDLGVGAYLVVGVVPADQEIKVRNASMEKESMETLDWMYEE